MQDAGERAGVRVLVRHRADAIAAAAMVKAFVHGAGGSGVQAAMIATATAELAQNIVSHAGGDGDVLAWLEHGDVVVRARSAGRAASAGTTRRGLGQGQAAVRRMMDHVDFEATPAGGLVVTARVRLEPQRSPACR